MGAGPVTVSVVSHGHGAMLPALLADLAACPEVGSVIVTRNIAEPDLKIIRAGWQINVDNPLPRGFGANHNAAFRRSATPFFAILNPDVRLERNPFPALLAEIEGPNIALCAPAVVNPSGVLEDSAREFPSPFDLLLKLFSRYEGRLDFRLGDSPRPAPWVAGMFMLIRREDFLKQSGFDERYFLYYEDVDLCARLWKSGRRVMLCPNVHVIHDARRASRRDARHMLWHARSMARYFRRHWRYAMRRSVE